MNAVLDYDVDDYTALPDRERRLIDVLVMGADVDYTRCYRIVGVGRSLYFYLYLQNDAGSFYLGDDGEIARECVRVPLPVAV